MREAVIVSAVRLPTGKFLGTLKEFQAPELGALVVREAVRRAGIDPATVDECIMGNVVSAGAGQAPARQAALKGGLADHVAALTINKVCGSGLKAVMLAAQGIATGDASVVVAGGMESMSNAPYLLPRVREGLRLGPRVEFAAGRQHTSSTSSETFGRMGLGGEVGWNFIARNGISGLAAVGLGGRVAGSSANQNFTSFVGGEFGPYAKIGVGFGW